MIKPLVDDRKYRVIRLTNNLDVTMISDISSGRCSASLSVGVGSFNDDEDVLGLAHFTEHMIFLGSKSFPKPGDFEDHLSNYFGITNAFTQDETTTFYFEIGCRGFPKALLMFSRMFSEPLFDINFMSKEIDSVNSENDKNQNQDNWREHQLIKNLSNPNHPFNRFNTGNNYTLNQLDPETLNRRLLNFYKKYYTPQNMKLVVLANTNLDIMQSNIAQYFSDIRLETLGREVKLNSPYELHKAYGKDQLGKLIWYNKISPTPNLDIIFALDEIKSLFQYKPMDYVSYILKYSGDGSLIKYLKSNKLASKVEVGVISSYKNFSQFAVSVTLTDKGLDEVVKVIDLCFAYINLVKSQPADFKIYHEIHNITKTQFKFLEKNERYGEYLAALAGSMFSYTYRELLYGDFIHSFFNATMIENFFKHLVPENAIILIGSDKDYKQLNNTQISKLLKNAQNNTEVWYKTKFYHTKFDTNMIKILNNEKPNHNEQFSIRPQNEFITEENNIVSCLDDGERSSCIKEMKNQNPSLYLNEKDFKVWYKMDRTFLVPRVHINFNLITSKLRTDWKNYLVLKILFNYLNDEFESTFADLKESGNELTFKFDENGYDINLILFSDLVQKVTEKLFYIFFNPNINENNFKTFMSLTMEEVKSFSEAQPYIKSKVYFNKIVKNNVTTNFEIIEKNNANLSNLFNYSSFNSLLKNILPQISINSLFYGFFKPENLDITLTTIKKLKNLKMVTYSQPSEDTIQILENLKSHKLISQPIIYRIKNDLASEKNGVVQNYFQVGPRDFKRSLMMNLLEMIWGNMFYYYLRTQKQLGYIVSANKEFLDKHMYFVFIVQGNKKTPSEMNLEIDNILWRLRDKIISLTEPKFKEVVFSIKSELKKREMNMKERTNRIWTEINLNTLDFSRREKLSQEISKISKNDLIEFFDNIFIDNPQKLSIQIYPSNQVIENKSEEIYYLNSNIKYKVTSDVNVLYSGKDNDLNTTDDI
jgi:insulysin